MARFSLGGEDDSEGPSSSWPRHKKQRTIAGITRPQLQEDHYDNERENPEPEEEEEEEEELVSERYDEEGEEEEDRSRTNEGRVRSGGGKGQIKDGELVGPSGDGSIPVILTDPDVLDCPICLEPLSIPVFQAD
ncbi:unnamed protein product [Ilex paraguariensis]|uniref:Uncharacterized protein n=1 Tax=Ilex paraguariensis TaxID=185542 RepID=A0ABC8SDX0_9AQUA